MKSIVVVTGGTRGIGAACVKHFCEKGATVAFCSRTEKEIKSFTDSLQQNGCNLHWGAVCDVSKPDQVKNFIQFVYNKFSRIDILIHNAGIGRFGAIDSLSLKDWRDVINIDLDGTYYVCREVMQLMKKQNFNPRGYILNIGSIAQQLRVPGAAAYAAAKGAQRIFTDYLFEEGRSQDILVSYLAIGSVNTDFSKRTPDKTGWKITPEEVAHFIYKLVSDFRSNYGYCIPYCEMRVRRPLFINEGKKE